MNARSLASSTLAALPLTMLCACAGPVLTIDAPGYGGREVNLLIYGAVDSFGASTSARITFRLDAQGRATVPVDGNSSGFGNLQVNSGLVFTRFPLYQVPDDHYQSTTGAVRSARILLRRRLGDSACTAIIDSVLTPAGEQRTTYDQSAFDMQPCANFRP